MVWYYVRYRYSRTKVLLHSTYLICSLIQGFLYSVGGCDENNMRLNTVERYNPSTDSWSFITEMSTCRSSPCVVADKYLYVMGGVSYVGMALPSVERYDPHTNSWTTLQPMNSCRASACGAVVNGKIFVIGEFDHIESFDNPSKAPQPF